MSNPGDDRGFDQTYPAPSRIPSYPTAIPISPSFQDRSGWLPAPVQFTTLAFDPAVLVAPLERIAAALEKALGRVHPSKLSRALPGRAPARSGQK